MWSSLMLSSLMRSSLMWSSLTRSPMRPPVGPSLGRLGSTPLKFSSNAGQILVIRVGFWQHRSDTLRPVEYCQSQVLFGMVGVRSRAGGDVCSHATGCAAPAPPSLIDRLVDPAGGSGGAGGLGPR